MQQSLADIDFTEEDFSLLREALDQLARKQNDGINLGDLFFDLMSGNMPQSSHAKLHEEKKKLDDKRRIAENDKLDKVFTLQYKIVQFRKYLIWAASTPKPTNTHTEEAAGEAPTSPD